MNMTSAFRQLPLMISVMLISAVAYALFIQPAQQSSVQETKQFKAEILSELAAFESRLEHQVSQLNYQAQSINAITPAGNSNNQIAALSQQIGQILQRQERQQKRLEALEQRLLAKLNEENVLAHNATRAEIFSVSDNQKSETQQGRSENTLARQSRDDEIATRRLALQIAKYKEALYEEEQDAEWSATMQQSIVNVIDETEQLAGVHLQTSECGTTLCKLEVYIEEGDSVEEKVQMLMVNRPWQGESFVSFEFDGHGEIFFARDGAELP
jgi:ribosomal protein S6